MIRAMLLSRPRPVSAFPLEHAELEEPTLGAHDVLIEVNACAVCRTDLQLAEGDLEARVLPIVPGHQAVGTVRETGHGVSELLPGTRVGVAWLGTTCGVCRFCTSGRENLCERSTFTGWDHHGGYAERMVARSDAVFPLPADADPVAIAPLLCGGAIGLRSLRVSGIQPGGRLGLYGFGASATCVIQIAISWGCEVFVCTRSEAEQERARSLGAAWVGGLDDRPPALLDAAITTAPVGRVVADALPALDRGGVVAINAIHLDRMPEIDYSLLWWERQIRSVANVTRDDVRDVIELAARIPIVTEVEEHPLAAANEALQRVATGRVRGAAVLRV